VIKNNLGPGHGFTEVTDLTIGVKSGFLVIGFSCIIVVIQVAIDAVA